MAEAFHLDYECALEKSERPFGIPNMLLANAGPTTISPRVLRALSQPIVFLSGNIRQVINNIKTMLRYVFQTKNEIVFVHHAASHGANEAVIANLTERGDTIIIPVMGYFGDRLVAIAERYDLNIVRLQVPCGEVFALDYLEEQIIKHKPTLLFITHCETTVGVLQPLEGLGDICHKHNCLLAVDAVVTIAAVPLFVDRWQIDAVVGGSQKAIGAPPALAVTTFSPLAKEKIWSRKSPSSFYFDVKELAVAWGLGENSPTIMYGCYYTYNSCMLYAIHEALSIICETGLENIWRKHKECAKLFWSGLEQLRLKPLVEKVENRFCAVTPIVLPADIKMPVLWDYLAQRYNLEVSLSNGNKIRVGFLGHQARPEVVKYVLKALEESIAYIRKHKVDKPSENSIPNSFSIN